MLRYSKWLNCWLIIAILAGFILPLPTHAAMDTASANFMPWSGYWWPFNVGGLATGFDYDGHPAPLEKYDSLTSGKSQGSATQWYLSNSYDPNAPNWYGMCGAWSSAAVTEDIDFQPTIVDKVLFKVGDKKGLMTACHEYDPLVMANSSDDPTVFHDWLLRYIKTAGLAFFADLDASAEIWNYPIYSYSMTTTSSGTQESVSCQIWYADDQVQPDFQGTKTLTKTYTYDLFTDDKGNITGGAWTGASVVDHPQVLVLPTSQHTANPYLDCNVVRNLALLKDDDLESDQTVAVSPGDYKLLLLNQDDYRLETDPGDTIILNVAKDSNATASLTLQIRDGAGQLVTESKLTSVEQEFHIASIAPPYTLTFTADRYEADNIYSLNYDLKKSFEIANTKIQKGFWGGFALTNNQNTPCDKITVVGYDQNGRPLATYLGPFTLDPGKKQTFLTSDFDVLPVDRDQLTGVKIMAASPLATMNLFGYFGRSMSCYGAPPSRSQLVIPDISTSWNFSRSIQWGLYNPGLTDVSSDLKIYRPNGTMLDSTTLLVPANRALQYDSHTSPFVKTEDHAWVMVKNENNGLLQSHIEWMENGVNTAEALGTLGTNRNFFVPQVVAKGYWSESITLINVADAVNTVTLTLVDQGGLATTILSLNPFEKTSIELSTLFPGIADSVLNRSAMEIVAEQDIAGFINLATSGDDIYFPLLDQDDIHQKLTIPHVASDDSWWTGFALFNPSQTATVSYLIEPFDSAGNRRSDLTIAQSLAPQSKQVMTIKDLFGNADRDISFVTFSTTSGPGLAGVYGIGNLNNPMLSGTVMR